MAHNALHELDPTASLISSPSTPTSLLFLKHIRVLLVLGAFHWLPVAIQISYYLSWGHFSPAPPCWTYPSSFLLRETPQLPSIEAPHQSLQHSVALLQDRFYYVVWFFFFFGLPIRMQALQAGTLHLYFSFYSCILQNLKCPGTELALKKSSRNTVRRASGLTP